MKLETILEHHESQQMRLAVRVIRNRAILESRTPQTGAYWWMPTPDGKWVLDAYYDSEFRNNTMHDIIWRKYALDRLAVLWDKDSDKLRRLIGDKYAGLPRGRVSKAMGGIVVSHGDDVPITNGMKKVLGVFNLSGLNAKKVRVSPDDHENMMPGDPEAVQEVIGVDLGLRGSFHMDFDDDFDDDDY